MIRNTDTTIICKSATIAFDWRWGPKYLGSSQDVVPNRRPSKVNVKVSVAALHAHKAVSAETEVMNRGISKGQRSHSAAHSYCPLLDCRVSDSDWWS